MNQELIWVPYDRHTIDTDGKPQLTELLMPIKESNFSNLFGVSGIYAFAIDNEIIYIGQSKDIKLRVRSHLNTERRLNECIKRKNYEDSIVYERYKFFQENIEKIQLAYLPVSLTQLNEYEKYYIEYYKPRFNIQGTDKAYVEGHALATHRKKQEKAIKKLKGE